VPPFFSPLCAKVNAGEVPTFLITNMKHRRHLCFSVVKSTKYIFHRQAETRSPQAAFRQGVANDFNVQAKYLDSGTYRQYRVHFALCRTDAAVRCVPLLPAKPSVTACIPWMPTRPWPAGNSSSSRGGDATRRRSQNR
jgi:hypothetical protein